MSDLVVDASMALAWCFGDESDADAVAVLRHVASEGAVVPQHWSLEVANGLLTAARRGRITRADHQSIVTLLDGLPIDVDEGTSLHALRETAALARDHGLSAYDAAYLELAARRRARLATLDGDLRLAARSAGVTLLPDPADRQEPGDADEAMGDRSR